MKHCLFVVEHFHPYIGGAETLSSYTAKALVDAGWKVTVVTSMFKKGLPTNEVWEGIHIRRSPVGNRYLFTFLSILDILRVPAVSIIQTTSYNAALPAFLAAKIKRVPVVITFHEVWGELWDTLPFLSGVQRKLFKRFEQFLLTLPFDRFIAVSKHTAQALKNYGVSEQRVGQIYNGLNYDQFKRHAPANPSKELVCVCRLGPAKGIPELLNAWTSYEAKYTQGSMKLVIPTYPAGIYNQLKPQLDAMQASNRFSVYHELSKPELQETIQNACAVVIPSVAEGFCFVAVEASAMHVPVVAKPITALPETVSGKHIWVNGSSPQAWHQAFQRAFDNSFDEIPLYKFELSKQVDAYLKTYEELLKAVN